MKILNEQKRTVSSDIEYIAEDVVHKFEVHYLSPRGDEKSEEFDTFDKAFERAIWFAEHLMDFDEVSMDDKKKVLKSLYIFDNIEDRDVTTAELKNRINKILNDAQ